MSINTENQLFRLFVSIDHTSTSHTFRHGKLCPGSRHLWYSFITHAKMRFFLVIFYSICCKNGMSFIRIISKLAFCCAFKNSWILTKLIVSTNLIQRILKMEALVEFKIDSILFLFKWFCLFSSKILTPTSGMIPVTWF